MAYSGFLTVALVLNNKLWGVNNCLKPQYRKPLACLAVSRRKDPVIFEPRKLRYICRICILKIKVSTILEIIRRNYHLTKQNWLVCKLPELCYYSTISYFFSPLSCMHDKFTRAVMQEMLPFGLFCFARSKIILWGIFGFVAPFVLKKLLEESSPALPSQVR